MALFLKNNRLKEQVFDGVQTLALDADCVMALVEHQPGHVSLGLYLLVFFLSPFLTIGPPHRRQ
jgi:hypothetical protein